MVTLLAAAPSDPTGIFLQYGAIGAMLVVLAWFAWSTVKRERDRNDELFNLLQERDRRAVESYGDIVKAVGVLADLREDLRELIRRREV